MITPHQLSQVESKLTAAVLKAKQEGKTIWSGQFGLGTVANRYHGGGIAFCPVGALLNGTPAEGSFTCDAAKILGIESGEVWDFIDGFDGGKPKHGKTMTYLGARFRKRLLLTQ